MRKTAQTEPAKLNPLPAEVPSEVIGKIERATNMRPGTLNPDWLDYMVCDFHLCAADVPCPTPAEIREKLARIEKLLQLLSSELQNLPLDAQQSIALRKTIEDLASGKQVECERCDIREPLWRFVEECAQFERAANNAHASFLRGPGAPSNGGARDRYRLFDNFVEYLVRAIEFGGGEAIANPNTGGSGTLVDALTELAPYLPARAIPGFLSNKDKYSTEGLARVARLARSVARRRDNDCNSASSQMDKK